MLIPKFESMVELNDKSDGLTKHLGKKKVFAKSRMNLLNESKCTQM